MSKPAVSKAQYLWLENSPKQQATSSVGLWPTPCVLIIIKAVFLSSISPRLLVVSLYKWDGQIHEEIV